MNLDDEMGSNFDGWIPWNLFYIWFAFVYLIENCSILENFDIIFFSVSLSEYYCHHIHF